MQAMELSGSDEAGEVLQEDWSQKVPLAWLWASCNRHHFIGHYQGNRDTVEILQLSL